MSLFEEARQLANDSEIHQKAKIDTAYARLSMQVQQCIRGAAKEGKYSVQVRPSAVGMSVSDAVPKLLMDPVFQGFAIYPENPLPGDVLFLIEWH